MANQHFLRLASCNGPINFRDISPLWSYLESFMYINNASSFDRCGGYALSVSMNISYSELTPLVLPGILYVYQ